MIYDFRKGQRPCISRGKKRENAVLIAEKLPPERQETAFRLS